MANITTLLFDLDGTLIDTAPDMAYALNRVLQEQGNPTLPYATIRPMVSHGGAALTRLGFGEQRLKAEFEALRLRFLQIYLQNIARESALFEGFEELLNKAEQQGLKWGVVTNKPSWLSEPLMQQLNLAQRSSCLVSGDTTAERKPHPEPLLYACREIGVNPSECLYVGDAQRDIEAGNRAGMLTLAALFGYLAEDDQPNDWNADGLINHPKELWQWL
ncbi:MAG: phosphoglycolate phosphatase [Gammaproteobacteria bacterium]|nr:phosphoglycolate phosphatase [Gammaproteobacteria bacterium]